MTSDARMPAAIDPATTARRRQDQARRRAAVTAATVNMTPRATATHSALEMTAPRIRLTAASWAAPRRMAKAGANACGTREPLRTAAVSAIRRPTAIRVGGQAAKLGHVISLAGAAVPAVSGPGGEQQVGDPQGAEPLAGLVGDQHLVRGQGAAQVDGGGRDGDQAARGPTCGAWRRRPRPPRSCPGCWRGSPRPRIPRPRPRPARRRRAAARTTAGCPPPAWWPRRARRTPRRFSRPSSRRVRRG